MKKLLIIPMILLCIIANSQNLVPNPSFEDTVQCPYYFTQIDKSTGWNSYGGTPDYFNTCAIGSAVGIPDNDVGTQIPRSGNAYSGFYTFNSFSQSREYIGIELNQALVINHTYFVSFFVSRAVSDILHVNHAANKLGAKFSTIPYAYSNPIKTDNLAHIYSDSVVTDTLNWIEISGYFVADSAYEFLCIGNFFVDSLMSYVSFDSLSAYAYYYIDDILVVDSTVSTVQQIYNKMLIEVFLDENNDLRVRGENIESVIIIDMTGKVCHTYLGKAIEKINLNNLRNGLYLTRIQTSNYSFVRKILKKLTL